MERTKERISLMLESLIDIVGILVSVISIVVTLISIHDSLKERKQKSNCPTDQG